LDGKDSHDESKFSIAANIVGQEAKSSLVEKPLQGKKRLLSHHLILKFVETCHKLVQG
jgi:hypothetical protein